MTYWLINLPFLLFALAVLVAAVVVSRRKGEPVSRAAVVSAVVSLVILCIQTAVFDSLIIGVGLVDYDDVHLSGIRIGLAPIEDFAYTIAVVLLLPAVWTLLGFAGIGRVKPERNLQ